MFFDKDMPLDAEDLSDLFSEELLKSVLGDNS